MAYEGPLLALAWLRMACPSDKVAVDQSAFAVELIPAERGPRHSRRRISPPTLVVACCAVLCWHGTEYPVLSATR